MTKESDPKGTLLLRLARASIGEVLGAETLTRPIDVPWLEQQAATFVTLEKWGELRGCIGMIQPRRSLYDDVTDNAKCAAFHDPRFHPVEKHELEEIRIEVSVLSPLRTLKVDSEEELLDKLRPGVDGLILRLGGRQATFLPSVWRQLATPDDFVVHLKKKAGIPPRLWSEQMEVQTYTVDEFEEPEASNH